MPRNVKPAQLLTMAFCGRFHHRTYHRTSDLPSSESRGKTAIYTSEFGSYSDRQDAIVTSHHQDYEPVFGLGSQARQLDLQLSRLHPGCGLFGVDPTPIMLSLEDHQFLTTTLEDYPMTCKWFISNNHSEYISPLGLFVPPPTNGL